MKEKKGKEVKGYSYNPGKKDGSWESYSKKPPWLRRVNLLLFKLWIR